MLKDLILENKEKLEKENDRLSISMRGELEVIVRDENDRIVNYQKGANVVSDFMKQEIIHLLAGDVFSEVEETYKNTIGEESADIYTTFLANNHSPEENKDGMLFSGYPYFFDASNVPFSFVSTKTDAGLSNTYINDNYICPRYPVKMLFGTGNEYSEEEGDWTELLNTFGGTDAVRELLGYQESTFSDNINDPSNYYSNKFSVGEGDIIQCRTVQANSTEPITGPENELTSYNIFGISGAIKNCLITELSSMGGKYSSGSEMAEAPNRGVGRPSFIYASRRLTSVKTDNIEELPGFVKIGKSDARNYENKLIFSVLMPRTAGFYPYNGWILREAGLFSDTLFKTKGMEDSGITKKMPCGILLAKRYISPILKTSDNSIEFIWSIYIS